MNPEKSALIINTLAETYIQDQIAVKYEATKEANDWLLTRVATLKADLDQSENAVKDFSTEMDLITPEALDLLNRQLKEFRTRKSATEGKLEGLVARLENMEAAGSSGDRKSMAELSDDLPLEQAYRRLNSGGQGAEAAFDGRFAQLVQRARTEIDLNRNQVTALEKSIVEIETEVASQSKDLLALQQLERDAEATRQVFEYFQGRQKEISAQEGIHTPDSRILSKAIPPQAASSPRKGFLLMLSAMMGMLVGAASVLLKEMSQSNFRSSQEVEQATGVNVFAQIPKAPYTKRRRILNYLSSRPTSAVAEAVRNLRTSILLSNMDKPPQIIMMTSSLPGEGKTTQSLALSQSFSGMDKRVLLIECDIRRRTFQEYFNLRNQPGLITAVAGERPLEEIVYRSEEVGCDILVGEKSSINAADFFSSTKFAEFIQSLRDHYDVIIIDTPPVLVVPDARVIGRMVDAVVYMVHWNKTTHAQVDEGLHSFATIDVKVSGLVLSQIDLKKAQKYGGKYNELYSSYGYKYYRN